LGEAPLSELVVRDVTAPDELKLCVGLYEDVFRLGPGDGSLNTRLLVGIARNSGVIVGAFIGTKMVGFALSFLAYDRDKQSMYQYSQLAVVAQEVQGHGVGRQLKLAQRDAALNMGISTMRWSFDPFQVRNAHFNLNVLGARAFKVERNLYGVHGHGLDAGDSTDRLIAQWDLKDDAKLGKAQYVSEELVMPTTTVRELDEQGRAQREAMLVNFDDLFAKGFLAVACDLTSQEQAVYRFEKSVTE
jgi:predicted GNAT superfamily acetyltransferase